ncbi:hypothetical protein HZS_2799, partial [Henneguya salminicola]
MGDVSIGPMVNFLDLTIWKTTAAFEFKLIQESQQSTSITKDVDRIDKIFIIPPPNKYKKSEWWPITYHPKYDKLTHQLKILLKGRELKHRIAYKNPLNIAQQLGCLNPVVFEHVKKKDREK